MTTSPLRAGIIGCGTISSIYLKNAPRFNDYSIVACADLNPASAQARAAEYGITAMSVAELLASPDIDIVINLTIPAAHADVAFQAVAAESTKEFLCAMGNEDGTACKAQGQGSQAVIGRQYALHDGDR